MNNREIPKQQQDVLKVHSNMMMMVIYEETRNGTRPISMKREFSQEDSASAKLFNSEELVW